MKKYIHIATGIVFIKKENFNVYFSEDKKYKIPSAIVEMSKDWRCVDKTAYTILSFKPTRKFPAGYENEIAVLIKDGEYNWENKNRTAASALKEMLEAVEKGIQSIYSVRREFDGKIFTIGCRYIHYCTPFHKETLKKFYILGEYIFLNSYKEGLTESRIDNVTKCK